MDQKKNNYYKNANVARVKYIEKLPFEEGILPNYVDADRRLPINRSLYEHYLNDILKKYKNKSESNLEWCLTKEVRDFKLRLKGDSGVYFFTTDYIGPSRGWANQGEDQIESLKFENDMLLKSRVLAGHIVWPTYGRKYTTNQARGGNGFYDRIDTTLGLLQLYMDNKSYEQDKFEDANINELLKNSLGISDVTPKVRRVLKTFHNYKEFYEEIKTFERFCEMNILFDSFVYYEDETIKVKNLQTNQDQSLLPVIKPDEKYTENNLKCINMRESKIYSTLL